MNRDLDIWTGIDNGRMLNCGFYFVRPTDPVRNCLTCDISQLGQSAVDLLGRPSSNKGERARVAAALHHRSWHAFGRQPHCADALFLISSGRQSHCADAQFLISSGLTTPFHFHMFPLCAQTDNFMRTWLGRFNAEASDDIWEQVCFLFTPKRTGVCV